MTILAASPKSWSLNTYTINTWTDLVAGTAAGETVKGINIANPTAGSITITIRVASSAGAAQATILPATVIAAGAAQQLNIDALNLVASQKLQIFADVVGAEFYASGVTYA